MKTKIPAVPVEKPFNEVLMESVMRQTWQQIGREIMAALEESGVDSISRNELVEVVLDAGQIRTFGLRGANATPQHLAAVEWFEQLTQHEQERIGHNAFPLHWYS